ncbi:MAG: hypothetical protein Q9159_000522 [Coniocarpon cinnabarinum]
MTRIAGYINVIALALCAFMLISFMLLPAETTRRHYLNVCLIIGIVILQLGFIIPWANKPEKCYNEITPNSEHTSGVCAVGGAMVVFGGAAINMWILIRALSMHLQICWGIEPGRNFFWAAQVFGWALSVTLLSTEMSISGVSFRFGDYCHVNSHASLGPLWIPLLALAGISLCLQLSTFAYCLNVYIKHSLGVVKPSTHSSQAESSLTSFRSASARAVFRRVRKVVLLQWRGLAIAIIVVADVIFFSLVYTILDQQMSSTIRNPESLEPWLECLVIKQNKNACLHLAKPLAVNQSLLIAVLILLAIVGIEAFFLICRWQMLTGWLNVCRGRLRQSREMNEFVSLDAHRLSATKEGNIELSSIGSPLSNDSPYGSNLTASAMSMNSPASPAKLVTPLTRIENTNYYDEELAPTGAFDGIYHNPVTNFSRPVGNPSRFSSESEGLSTYAIRSKNDMSRQPALPKIDDT